MHTLVGNCPHCGAPIYVQGVNHSVLPAAPIYTCSCAHEVLKKVTTVSSRPLPDGTYRVIDGKLYQLMEKY